MGLITLRGRPLYTLMKIICGVSFMMYGYDAGVLGGVLLHKPFLDAMDNPTGTYTIPLITSSYSLAACVTSLIVAPFAFRLGRRGTVLLGNAVAIVGSAIQASAYSVPQLVVGRICTGFAIGCISSAVPTYLTECGMDIGDRGPANAFNAILLIGGGKQCGEINIICKAADTHAQFPWLTGSIMDSCKWIIKAGLPELRSDPTSTNRTDSFLAHTNRHSSHLCRHKRWSDDLPSRHSSLVLRTQQTCRRRLRALSAQ